jgi:hypothetical protein
MTTEKLIASVLGTEPESPAMALGSAWDRIVQDPEAYYVMADGVYRSDGFTFGGLDAREALALLPHGAIWQVKSTLELDGHTLVAIADALHGTEITEVKATLGTFDVEKYLQSKQWRAMAAIFEASKIMYHVTEWREGGEGEPLRLNAVHQLPVYPYPGLLDDLRRDAADFAAFVREQGLEGALEKRGRR